MTPCFVDTNPAVTAALRRAFAAWPTVQVFDGRFEDVIEHFPAFITAGNSFGIMDGGIDLAGARYFGPDTQTEVQRGIREVHRGCAPVGTAFTIRTGLTGKVLIYAPTMLYPMNVSTTINAYLAMKAALITAAWESLDRVLCPGLATLSGCMPPDVAATQMAQAYRHVLNPPKIPHWQAEREVFWPGFQIPRGQHG